MKHILKFKQGETLFNEGDHSSAMYIIEKGVVAVRKQKDGLTTTLKELVEGDLLGEMAFFDDSSRSASAVIVSPRASIVELPFDSLKQQYEEMPSWVRTVTASINNHLRSANNRIQELEKLVKELKGY